MSLGITNCDNKTSMVGRLPTVDITPVMQKKTINNDVDVKLFRNPTVKNSMPCEQSMVTT